MSDSRTQPGRRRRGVALAAVTWVVVTAGLILLGVNRDLRVHAAMAHNELASVQAHWLARAGVERAMALLEDDIGPSDSTSDAWYSDALSLREVKLGRGTFSVCAPSDRQDRASSPRFGLVDLGARANLNLVDANQLAAMADLSDSQVASILDWRDADDEAPPGGAERGYYDHLRYPYRIRNGPFRTSRELLLVRGIDLTAYHGEDVNENGLLDRNEDDLDASWPTDNGDGKLDVGLAGLTTVYSYELNKDALGNARLNINTADQQALAGRLGISDALAKAIVERRGRGSFGRVMDLLNVKASDSRPPNSPPPDGGASPAESEMGKVNEITLSWLAGRLDDLTTSDSPRLAGRINVNTAPRAVLRTLPQVTEDVADAIIKRRDSEAGAFDRVGDLLSGGVVNDEQFKAIAELVTVRSNVFEIRGVGTTSGGIRKTIVAVVDRGADPMTVLYWYQSE